MRDNNKFFLEPNYEIRNLLKSGDIDKFNRVLQIMAEHLSINTHPIIEGWHEQESPIDIYGVEHKSTSTPGIIYYSGPQNSIIKLDVKLKFMPEVIGGILAHEMMHYYLFSRDIYYVESEENEKFTDFATIYYGFGKFTLKGYQKVEWHWTKGDFYYTETYQIGYLTRNELTLIMGRIAKLRFLKTESILMNMEDYSHKFSRLKDFKDIIKINDYLSGDIKKNGIEKYLLKKNL